MLDLISTFIGFLAIAILWAVIMFFVLRGGFKIKRRSLIYLLFFFIGIGVVIILMGMVVEYTESPEFCGEACHPQAGLIVHDTPMEEVHNDYKHPGNNSMMRTHADSDVTCSKCHDAPGAWGKVDAYLKGIGDVYEYIVHDYDLENMEAHVPDEYCLKCHDGEVFSKAGEVITFNNTTANPHDDDMDLHCVDCHKPHQEGIGLSEEACLICHNIDEEQLEKHEETTEEDCMDCHNRDHPDSAYIPFTQQQELITNEFCSDCHEPINLAISAWSEEQISIYGNNCTSCHTEHHEKDVPHLIDSPYEDNCDSCHFSGVASHNPYDISFVNFTQKIDDEFCSDCHKTEYKLVSSWTSEQKSNYGDCTESCHTDHYEGQIPHQETAPYQDNCYSCHLDGTSHSLRNISYSSVTFDMENEFCMDCHKTEYDSLGQNNHDKRDCLDCHGEHGIVQVLDFEECKLCHTDGQVIDEKEMNDIPSSHDEKRRECGKCHDINVIHES